MTSNFDPAPLFALSIQVLTGGGPASSTESVALYAYWNALRFLDFGYSSTIIMASFLLISVICLIAWIGLQLLIPTYSSHPLESSHGQEQLNQLRF